MLLPLRFGGIFYMKYINEADQALIEGLNSLLEIERKLNFNNEFLQIHP